MFIWCQIEAVKIPKELFHVRNHFLAFSTHAWVGLVDVVVADFTVDVWRYKWIDIHHWIIILHPSLLVIMSLVLLFLQSLINIEFYSFLNTVFELT